MDAFIRHIAYLFITCRTMNKHRSTFFFISLYHDYI
nr:MAG TPA: hypothetical protein [Bacteriophage sp.]